MNRAFLFAILLAAACGGSPSSTKTETPTLPPDSASAGGASAAADKPATDPAATKPAADDGAKAGTTSEADARTMIDRMAAMFEELAKNVEGAGGDCGKLAVALDTWVTTNTAEMHSLSAKLEGVSDDVGKKLLPEFQTRMGAASQRVQTGVAACQNDDRVKAAVQKLMM